MNFRGTRGPDSSNHSVTTTFRDAWKVPSPVRVRLESSDQVLAEWQTTTWSTDDVLDEQRFAGVLYRVTGHTGPETDTDAVDTTPWIFTGSGPNA